MVGDGEEKGVAGSVEVVGWEGVEVFFFFFWSGCLLEGVLWRDCLSFAGVRR